MNTLDQLVRMARQARRQDIWDSRALIWKQNNPHTDARLCTLSLIHYTAIAETARIQGFASLWAYEMAINALTDVYMPLWLRAENIANQRLCDIRPSDALALAKTTIYAADEWYRMFTRNPARVA